MNIRSKRGTFYVLQDSVGGETEAVLGKYKHGLSQQVESNSCQLDKT